MISTASRRLVLSKPPIRRNKSLRKHLLFHLLCTYPTLISNSNPSSCILFSEPLIPRTRTRTRTRTRSRVNSGAPSLFHNQFLPEILLLFAFSLVLLCLRLFSNAFLPGFCHRWRDLIASSEVHEAQTSAYPPHLWQAIVAYEDRRFFRHCGLDPLGVARAVLSLSARGGGSTITQQLVKNTFLRNERSLSRKFVEMVLALAVERTMSKWRILSSYMCKIYWGHGIYGIESASLFYFGKHPSHLNLAESAMLVGMIPAPELRSPLRDCTRGKVFQCRVLKRMVEVGILDRQSARLVAKQSLNLHAPEYAEDEFPLLSFSREACGSSYSNSMKKESKIWNWENESKIWQVLEDMDDWASFPNKQLS